MKGHVLIIGYCQDTTIAHVRSIAQMFGFHVTFLNLADYLADGSIDNHIFRNPRIRAGGYIFDLDDFSGIYRRAYPGPDASPAIYSKLIGLEVVLDMTTLPVVNYPFGGWQNMSKPFQMLMLARHGFTIPVSRSTSIPDDYYAFLEDTREVIYKSNSGIRSIVERISTEHQERAERLVHCPTLFQERIIGDDVRVHVFRNEAYAVRIQSDAVDYRYYRLRGSFARLNVESSLPSEIEEACISFTVASEVALAGFDFKVDSKGSWYCLEMNPAPAFEMYDHVLDGVIAHRILEFLSGTT